MTAHAQKRTTVLPLENNGLSASLEKKIYQDKLGFLWYGTYNAIVFESGVYSYLVPYNHPTNNVTHTYNLLRTPGNFLWACTDYGLYKYDISQMEGKWVMPFNPETKGRLVVNSIVEGQDDDFYIGTQSGTIYHIMSDDTFVPIWRENDEQEVFVTHYFNDKGLVFRVKNNLYLHNQEQVIKLFDAHSNGAVLTRNGGLFPKNLSGTYQYQKDSYKFQYIKDLDVQLIGLPFEHVISGDESIFLDLSDQDLFRIRDDAIWQIDIVSNNGSTFTMTERQLVQLDTSVMSAIKSVGGYIWALTQDGISPYHYKIYPFEPYLNNYKALGYEDPFSCRGMTQDSEGTIFLYTYNGFFELRKGASEFEPLELKDFGPEERAEAGIYSIAMVNDNTLIAFGFHSDITMVDLKSKTVKKIVLKTPSSTPIPSIYDLKIIDKSKAIASTEVGLFEIDLKTCETKKVEISSDSGHLNEAVFTVLPSSDGTKLWIATISDGIYEWNKITGKILKINSKSKPFALVHDEVRVLYEDSKGNLWIGTTKGLQRISFPTYESKIYSTENGLPNGNITGILESDLAMWIGTYYGLAQINLKNDLIEGYFESDGLTHNEFNVKSAFKSADNTMFFGGLNGLIRFDPSAFTSFRPGPQLYLLGYEKFDKPTAENKLFQKNLNDITEFELPYEQNYLSLIFGLNDIYDYQNNTLQYKIPSLNDDWIDIGDTGRIDLVTLSPGSYQIHIRGFNSNGKASNIQTYNVTVKQIFYKRLWFVILLSVMSIFLVSIFYSVRWRQANQRIEWKNRILHLESRALAAQMNPHFIFNTLNHIQSAVLLKGEQEVNKLFGSFSKLLRLTLDNNRKDFISLKEELDYLKAYVYLEQARVDLPISVIWQVDPNLKKHEIHIPPMLLQPIVENAIQHGLIPKKGIKELQINISLQVETLVVVIQDNGIGRALSLKKNTNINYKSWATTIMNERISLSNLSTKEQIKIEIEDLYEDESPSGTRVTLNIPI